MVAVDELGVSGSNVDGNEASVVVSPYTYMHDSDGRPDVWKGP